MNLRDYLLDKGITQAVFAQQLDVGRAHLSCVITGNRKAGKKLAKNIHRETNGVISQEAVLDGSAVGYEGKMKRAIIKESVPKINRFSLM